MDLILLTLALMFLNSLIMAVAHPAFRAAIFWVFRKPPRSLAELFAMELLNMFFVLCAILQANVWVMKLFGLWK